jgi:hypothetical protein
MAVTYNYGAAPTYVKIANQTLSTTSASVTFSNIPQGYTDLRVVLQVKNSVGDGYAAQLQYNSDTASNYSWTGAAGYAGSSANSFRGSSVAVQKVGFTSATSGSAWTSINIDILNYTNPTTFKSCLSRSNSVDTNSYVFMMVGLWRSTQPITSLTFTSESSGTFAAGSTFTLYGIEAAFVPKATGGNLIVQDGTYWYHTFLSSGTFTPSSSLTNVDYLVIAGGGGGTGYYVPNGYAGPGAGGLRSTVGTTGGGGSLESQISLSSGTSYTISVGAGGTSGGSGGSSGSNSSISGTGLTTITSLGGGARNTTGGSGGGGSYDPNTYGLGTAGQGYRGGNGYIVGGGDTMGGGGGGAGAVGANATSTAGGNGGAGVQISAFSVPTLTGVSGFYAGGGGGAAEASGRTAGTGGSGGGGNGAVAYINATNAIPNTGSGGGAAGAGAMGRGGSGLVIVRYPI